MAQVNIVVLRGNKTKDVTVSTGTLTLASDAVAISYNQSASAALTRGEVLVLLEMLEQFFTTHSFPAA